MKAQAELSQLHEVQAGKWRRSIVAGTVTILVLFATLHFSSLATTSSIPPWASPAEQAEAAIQAAVLKEKSPGLAWYQKLAGPPPKEICNEVPTAGKKTKKVCFKIPDYAAIAKETLPPMKDAEMDKVPSGQVNVSEVMAIDAVFEANKHIKLDESIGKSQISDLLKTSKAKLTTWLTSTFYKNLRIQTMRADEIANSAAEEAEAVLNRRKSMIDHTASVLEASSHHVKDTQERRLRAAEKAAKEEAENLAAHANIEGSVSGR